MQRPTPRRCCLSFFLVIVAGPAPAGVLHVPREVPGIQEAIDQASPGDTVLVAPGDYVVAQPVDFRGKDLDLRSEAGPEATVIRMSSTPADPRFATVVVFESEEGKAHPATLEGFTITGGAPDRSTERIAHGGGILSKGSAPTILRCIISGNLAGNGGGVAAIDGAAPTLRECRISGNNTGGFGDQGKGGGVVCENAFIELDSCRIEGNWTPYYEYGGGIHAENASVRLTRCELVGNTASGVSAYRSTLSAEDCIVLGNRGHGVRLSESFADLRGTVLAENDDHGLTASGGSGSNLLGCVIRDNVQGALRLGDTATADLDHSTVSGNVGPAFVLDPGSRASIHSSIAWDNAGGLLEAGAESALAASFSCIESPALWPGEGNIRDDPRFCGWGLREVVHVDPSRPGPGDGTALHPFASLRDALDFSLALGEDSPCRRAGQDGADMGAPAVPCAAREADHRRVLLASGDYPLAGSVLSHHASLVGSGPTTVLIGAVRGLRTGSSLGDLMVTGDEIAIQIERGQAPSIERCAVQGVRQLALICREGSRPAIADSTFEGCQGGIDLEGASPTLERCRIARIESAGMWATGASAPVLTDCLIEDNREQGFVARDAATPTLIGCRIRRNKEFDIDNELGGGVTVRDSAAATLIGCTISSNRGTGVSCRGESLTVLEGCTISGNMPQVTPGGGISFFQGAAGRLVNCLVTGNAGGAVRVAEGSIPLLQNCTIAHNQGGAVVCDGGAGPLLVNCIVVASPPDETCGDVESTLTGVDPLFVRPGTFDFTAASEDYEQPPEFIVDPGDYRLRPGSPAIDAGLADSAPLEDLEGNLRPCGAGVDQGAYEAGGCRGDSRVFRRGEVNRDGSLDLSDPLAVLGYLFLGQRDAVACEKAADADDSGALDLNDPVSLLNFLFLGGPPPAAPANGCGADPTPDALGCEAPSPCA
jgi:parallel beta-helix repeat protein